MKGQGCQSLLVNPLFFIMFLICCCLGCQNTPHEQKTKEPESDTQDLIVLTINGDTITTGESFQWAGKSIATADLPPPKSLPTKTTTVSAKKQEEYALTRVNAMAWPNDLPAVIPGQGDVPLPYEIRITPDTFNLPLPIRSQARPFRRKSLSTNQFETLTMEEGLPVSVAHSMLEDDKGHFWMGSEQGIIRFDGKEFLLYDLREIMDFAMIVAAMKDKSGAIWFKFMNFGVRISGKRDAIAKFDGKQLIIYDLAVFDGEIGFQINKKDNFYHYDIIEDQNQRIWVASDLGLIQIDDETYRVYAEEQGLLAGGAFKVFLNKRGGLWICHANGNTLLDKGLFTSYEHQLELSWEDWDDIPGAAMDLKGTIWTSKGQQFHAFTRDSFIIYKTLLPNLKALTADSLGFIWASSDLHSRAGGLLRLDPKQLSIRKYTEKDGLIDHFHLPLLSDSRGSLWLKSANLGIQRFSPRKIQYDAFENLRALADVSSIVEDRPHNLWFGLHHPALVARFDGSQYTFFDAFDAMYKYGHVCRDLYLNQKQHLWIGGLGVGVYRWDNTQLLEFTPAQGLPGDQVYAITEDLLGNMWFGTLKDGLGKYDGTSWTHYQLNKGDENQGGAIKMDINTIRALLTDSNGKVWAGSYGGGLLKFDGDYTTIYTTTEGLSDNEVVSLLEDEEGYIWAGTAKGGVNRFNPADSVLSFQTFTTKDGLSSNAIWTITEDGVGNIWLGAGDCLNLLQRESKAAAREAKSTYRAVNYCQIDGIAGGEFYANATLRDSKNQIWWGSSNSLLKLPPNVYPSKQAPGVELTTIDIAQTAIHFRALDDSIAQKKDYWAAESKELNFATIDFDSVVSFQNYPLGLKLPHNINHLIFHFSPTNHPRLEEVRFSYFIEGVDNNWSTASKDNRAEYRGLAPGDYTLQIKAVSLEGYWGPAISYPFSIRPPWWQSIWAYGLYAILIGAILYGVYLYNLRRQLEKAETRRMKELDFLKTRLYTNITHEFRTPLTVIMGMTEQLSEDAQQLPKSRKEKLSNGLALIQRNGQNLLRLINQLLDLSKLDSGKLKLNMIQGDIVVYLQYLTESFFSMADDEDIRLTFYAEERSLLMDYDEEKIQQIVYNLLSNAIKFTPERGKVIFHILKEKHANSEQLQMKVIDTGVGMTPEDLQHVFDRFYQADGSSTRKGEGTGIGLALTKELVELMKGEIQVESTPGKGSTFTIQLPIRREYPLQQTPSSRHVQVIPPLPVSDAIETSILSTVPEEKSEWPILLIIEDNVDVAMYIKSLLEKEYVIHTAENGQIGIERAIDLVPDIIISDVMMPEKDGYEVCYTLKHDERTSHIPIILLTARAGQEDRIDGLHHGADAYLTKPFQKRELMIRLKKLVELRQQLQKRFSAKPITPRIASAQASDDKESQFLQKLRRSVLEQMDKPDFGVPQLAHSALMSHTQVYRKLKALTDQTPSQFIRSIRLQKGKELLLTTDMTISEIAYEVGFSDPNYFSRTFNKEFNVPPRDFRK